MPSSRLEADNGFNMGDHLRYLEMNLNLISSRRDLQMQSFKMFTDILRTQLVLKNIVSGEEFDAIKDFIYYDFATDNHFTELKERDYERKI